MKKSIKKNLSWELALLAMQSGEKVRHEEFTVREKYIWMEEGKIKSLCNKDHGTIDDFLRHKSSYFIEKGWSIVNPRNYIKFEVTKEIIKFKEKNVPLVTADKHGYVNCPFCYEKHAHGEGNGHRVPDCIGTVRDEWIVIAGVQIFQHDGYFVKHK